MMEKKEQCCIMLSIQWNLKRFHGSLDGHDDNGLTNLQR